MKLTNGTEISTLILKKEHRLLFNAITHTHIHTHMTGKKLSHVYVRKIKSLTFAKHFVKSGSAY